MKAHVVLAHPETRSFNGHLARISRTELADAGYDHSFSDLYAMNFDPCESAGHYRVRKDAETFHPQTEQCFNAANRTTPADVDAEVERLLGCDLLLLHFPLWWFGPPAILKGWMDRVFLYGRVYRSTMRYDAGICAGKRVIACVTTGAGADSCAYDGKEGDTRLHLWPVMYAFRYLGFEVLEPEILHGVGGTAFMEGREGGLSTLDAHSERWASALKGMPSRPSVPYNGDGEFDDRQRLRPEAPSHTPFIRHGRDFG